MKSKIIIITGASDGIGRAAARRLSADGHHVIVIGHSRSKTEEVARELNTEFYVSDFTKLHEVRTLADKLLERYPKIDVFANNAGGVFYRDRRVTPDGHEITFQVNYLAGFLLTIRLLDRLLESRAMVICTSSIANRTLGNIDIDDLENEKSYSPIKAYGDTKLAQILFIRELHRRYEHRGLSAAAFHPGNIASNFSQKPGTALRIFYRPPLRYLWLTTPEKGSDTLVFLAEEEPAVDFPSGEYFVRRKIGKPNRQANRTALANELWNRSKAMINGI